MSWLYKGACCCSLDLVLQKETNGCVLFRFLFYCLFIYLFLLPSEYMLFLNANVIIVNHLQYLFLRTIADNVQTLTDSYVLT